MKRRWLPLLALLPSLALPVLAGSARAADAKATAATPAPDAPTAPAADAKTPAKKALDPNVGSQSGLPLPRFVSLRADAVNMRVGPGDQYPISWVYHRAGLPVEILREYDIWRLVMDSDGTKGWMHEATLVGTRHFVVSGHDPVMLRNRPDADAGANAQLMPGVVGLIERCHGDSGWCRVRVGRHRGWLQRSDVWGTLPNEDVH